jgi:sugar/nucleoside kinase (ribokinase family)
MPEPFILGIGAATWDRFMLVPEFPRNEGVTAATQAAEQGGGPVATALCVLASCGHRTQLLDAQGDDPAGVAIREELRRHGVGLDYTEVHPGGRSALAHISVRENDGARHICFLPASAGEADPLAVARIPFSNVRLLHLNGRHEAAARAAAKAAHKHGVTISFDGDLRIVAKDFALAFAGVTSLEKAVTKLSEGGPALVVVTDGVRGSWVWPRGEAPFHQPTVPADRVVDTTGCGDVYHGAFLHGWVSGWTPRQCAAFASGWAAKTAAVLGGRGALMARPQPDG